MSWRYRGFANKENGGDFAVTSTVPRLLSLAQLLAWRKVSRSHTLIDYSKHPQAASVLLANTQLLTANIITGDPRSTTYPEHIHPYNPSTFRQKDITTLKGYFDPDTTADEMTFVEHNDFQQGSTMEVDLAMRVLSRMMMTMNLCWMKH